jgi:hypothetical protein
LPSGVSIFEADLAYSGFIQPLDEDLRVIDASIMPALVGGLGGSNSGFNRAFAS